MSKIRIPRKKKKHRFDITCHCFPNVPKLERYLCYFDVEYGIKEFHMTAEELYKFFGRYTLDDIVWWNWIRRKHLYIEPKLNKESQEYWNYFVSEGIIK